MLFHLKLTPNSFKTFGARLFPDDSIAAVPHLFNKSPPASSHSEGEVRVEFEEVVGDVGDV